MQNFPRAVIALLLLLLFPSLAFAAPFTVEHLAVYDSIIEGEQAAFDVRLTNNQDFTDTFRFSTNDLLWDMLSDPLYHYFSGVDIRPGDSETVRLTLRPARDLEFGRYKVSVMVRGERAQASEELPLFITFRPAKPLIMEYLAAVHKIVEVPVVVDPRNEVKVKVNLINRNPKNLENVGIVFSSRLLNRNVTTSLAPLERKVVEEVFTLDSMTPPQNDTLTVQLVVDGSVLEPTIIEQYSIGAFPDIVEDSSSVEKSFLKAITTTAYINRGNVEGSTVIELPTSHFRNYFTKSAPESFEVRKGKQRFAVWEFSLKPGESLTITRVVSYRPRLALLLILLTAFAFYYLFRSPVTALKRASILTLRDSGISELKVIIHLRSRSEKAFERMTITDTIQTIAEVSAGQDVGTLKPDSVYNDGTKTIVKWEMDTFEAGEERILSYTIKSKFAILDSVTLPPVVVRFYTKKGAKLITRSDAVTVRV